MINIEPYQDNTDLSDNKIDNKLIQLKKSPFRARFRFKVIEINQLENKSLDIIMLEGRKFILERLAAYQPKNDGAQTPMKGHPIFIAQHATGTCCRGCLLKWHFITTERALNEAEITYVLQIIRAWIMQEITKYNIQYSPIQGSLF